MKVFEVDGNTLNEIEEVFEFHESGARGPIGETGATGPGISAGGLLGQIWRKASDSIDFLTELVWPHKSETYNDAGSVAASTTINVSLNDGGWQKVTITGNNATITITDWDAIPSAGYLTLELSGAGAFTGLVITNGITSEGNALDLSTGTDFIQCASRNAGSTVILSQVGKDYS